MPGVPWTDSEKNLLRQLVKQGLGPIRIKRRGYFSDPGQTERSVYGISRQAQRLCLVNPEASKRVSLGRRRSIIAEKEHGAALTSYLLKYGKTYPTWYIAQKWQLSEGMVRHRLHKLGIHRTWAQSVALPLAKFKLPQYRKDLCSKLKQTFQTRKRQRLLDFERRTREVQLQTPKAPHRVCEQCLVARPMAAEFFPAFRKFRERQNLLPYKCRHCFSGRAETDGFEGPSRANPKTVRLANQISQLALTIFNNGVPLIQRTCIRCQETWPLLADFWR